MDRLFWVRLLGFPAVSVAGFVGLTHLGVRSDVAVLLLGATLFAAVWIES